MSSDRVGGQASGALPGWAAALLVFVASGAVLVIELSALRLLAPYLGLTLEMSSAVIGVALAAIAFGTWAGGRAADRVDARRWLGPVVALGGVLTWLVLPAVRGTAALLAGQELALVLLSAALTLFVPAALLSAVTPMVIRIELRDIERTGSVVGRLSAIGTLGALSATFGTGFVLFAVVPTSRILLGVGACLVALGATLMVLHRWRPTSLVAGSATIVAVGSLAVLAPTPCQAETQYHCASVVVDEDRPAASTLVLDRLRHSYVDTSDPTYLDFAYVRAIVAGIDSTFPSAEPLDVLHIGAGGLTVARYLAETRRGSTGVVLEIDGGVVDLVRERIAPEPAGVEVRVVDARVALRSEPAGRYDVVVGDAFGSVAVPWHLATKEAVELVREALRTEGIYVLNVIDQPPLALLRAQVATVSAVFPAMALVSTPSTLTGEEGGNAVLVASASPVHVERLSGLVAERDSALVVTAGADLGEFARGARVLTDDLAPVDQLLTPYVVQR